MKKQASLVIFVWSAETTSERTKICHGNIPMTYSLSHTKWNCKYHRFLAKYREERHSMSQGGLMSAECYGCYANGNINIIEAEVSSEDHVHILK